MAGGFDGTGITTGILGSINQGYAQQRKDQTEGDLAQYKAFQQASEEYQKSKSKASEEGDKINSLAPTLRFDNDESDQARMASLAVARDAVSNNWTTDKHTPYLQEAYKRTKADIVANPDKWKVQPTGNPDTGWDTDDTDPANTKTLQKFNPNLTVDQIEQIRSGKVDKPYSNIHGGVYPNAEQFDNAILANKAQALIPSEVAKQDALTNAKYDLEEGREKAAEHKIGLDMPDSAFSDAPQGMGSPQASKNTDATLNSLAIKESDLNAPIGSEGIKINAPPPSDGTEGLSPKAAAASVDSSGKFNPLKLLDYVRQNDPVGANVAEGLVDGSYPINANALDRTRPDGSINPMWRYLALAKRIDHTWDPTIYAARQKLNQEYLAGGVVGKQILANNTALGHIGLLDQAIDGLQNGNTQILNKIANGLNAQTGSVAPVVFNSIMDRVAPEVVTAYRPSAGTGEEVAQARADLSRDLSGPQGHAVALTIAQALKTKMDATRQAYINQAGPVFGPVNVEKYAAYAPEAKDTMNRMGLSTDISQQRQVLKGIQQPQNQNTGSSALPKLTDPNEVSKLPSNVPGFIDPNGVTRKNPNYKG